MVWSPQLGATAGHVADAMALLPDPRATHFWDPDSAVGAAYQGFFDLDAPAWDVWMLFDGDASWSADAPEPDWWEHQLGGLPEERRLDPERFAMKAAELLRGGSTAETQPGRE